MVTASKHHQTLLRLSAEADGDFLVTLVTGKGLLPPFPSDEISQLLEELTMSGPPRTRTADPLIKSQLLYQSELAARPGS